MIKYLVRGCRDPSECRWKGLKVENGQDQGQEEAHLPERDHIRAHPT